MINTSYARRGIAVASHSLAAQSAAGVLREGGNAIEAMVCAAATIAVVYPHMTGIGGDAFWVIAAPGESPLGIDASGPAAAAASIDFYTAQGLQSIPSRGPLAANTVAGTVGGWDCALEISRTRWGGRLPLSRLLADSIYYAGHGVPVTLSQELNTRGKHAELEGLAGFAQRFMPCGEVPRHGSLFVQKTLAATMQRLAEAGLADFYRGDLARAIAQDLCAAGSPLTLADLEAYAAREAVPLELTHSTGMLYNMTPPTQGVISLAILGILDRLGLAKFGADSADHVHAIVEATKQAFAEIRDRHVTDPAHMRIAPQSLLEDAGLQRLAENIDMKKARPWGGKSKPGGTVWMGVIDSEGRAVSFIQSIYHEFGSGVVLPGTQINWQNRGCSFSLTAGAVNCLQPGKKPFHTLNPAFARLRDGRTMVYGTMGGDGQPQTQAAVFTRYAVFNQPMQHAISAPRWLLGRTWGSASETLKLEARFGAALIEDLRERGHNVEVLGDFEETMGHAGALVRHPNGALEGGYDPRGDGSVAGY
ncbi:MAG: gamma-glutamyltransferase family protein [Betaproteobacteria bacterium]|nr:gamma-glutamyltransferase family protein [Betaproteobacteria bacterium]